MDLTTSPIRSPATCAGPRACVTSTPRPSFSITSSRGHGHLGRTRPNLPGPTDPPTSTGVGRSTPPCPPPINFSGVCSTLRSAGLENTAPSKPTQNPILGTTWAKIIVDIDKNFRCKGQRAGKKNDLWGSGYPRGRSGGPLPPAFKVPPSNCGSRDTLLMSSPSSSTHQAQRALGQADCCPPRRQTKARWRWIASGKATEVLSGVLLTTV